ncbi:endolytic transglycosylase MltG [Brevibacterium yomogidense]|uniref:Endolytic murein transglycosylase n=1 Tax=Brevibacterium yomogidense TaxID=946573 RepID=A0A1X6XG24_9MICO|nr:endolytic transglycosylase MltG [Brevibacterium yomogidense]SLM98224.1 protein YceG like [Brevibacterium yomogidense]
MHDVDDLDIDDQLTRSELKARRRRRMLRRRRTTTIVVAALLVLGIGGIVAVSVTTGAVQEVLGRSDDYEGSGGEPVVVEVLPGTSTTQIANQLVEEDVIKSSRPFIREAEEQEATFQARTYSLRSQMSSAAAVEAMVNPESAPQVVIPEGLALVDIQARMVESGMADDDVTAAIEEKTPADYGLDLDAPSLEGYLFPATYDVRPGATAEEVVQEMVDRTAHELDDAGIALDEAHELLTLASLVEIESPADPEVRRQVARVFLNRTGDDSETNGLLQSDATIAYIHGARDDLTTTAEEREDDNPYNTYMHPGLPPGPINSPGREAVDAAMDPADGDWQFFVAVDPDTGETRFAETYDEHLENVEEYREWLRSRSDGGASDG